MYTDTNIPMYRLGVLARRPFHRHVEVEEYALRLLGSDVDPDIGRVNVAVDHLRLQTRDQTWDRKLVGVIRVNKPIHTSDALESHQRKLV